MADTLTYVYAADITKSERDDNGDLLVYGKATGSDLDMDGQRCDPEWLKTAMPAWFEWGNIREMHQPVCAGVGVELTNDGDDWYIKSKVVDPGTAKKIEAGALKGYSIGVKTPVIRKRDGQEWIAGGSICETSYVDRPCLPTAKMMICKAAGVDAPFEPVEAEDAAVMPVPTPADLAKSLSKTSALTDEATGAPAEQVTEEGELERQPAAEDTGGDAQRVTVEVKGAGFDSDEIVKRIVAELGKRQFTQSERDDAADKDQALPDGSFPIKSVADLKNAIQAIGRAKDPAKAKAHIKARAKALGKENLVPDGWKGADPDLTKVDGEQTHDPAEIAAVRDGLISLIKAELDELSEGDPELCDVGELLCSLKYLMCWWEGEAAAGETDAPYERPTEETVLMAAQPTTVKTETSEPEKPGPTDDDAHLTELVKSAVADALKTSEERMKALEADLAKALALPEPGGPVLTRTATQEAQARNTDATRMESEANDLLRKAAAATDTYLAQGYRERARQLLEKAAA
ncbi:MAG TPA: hypothetical protein VGJ13_05220 [Pseudonocardiaceae bacterium]|jgi:hypothetical protein